MIAPTSEERIDTIAREAEGFIYCVSSLGVTGTRSSITTDLDSIVARIRAVTDTPSPSGSASPIPSKRQPWQQRAMAPLLVPLS